MKVKDVQYVTSALSTPKDAWDKLSMAEKAEMMKVAVKNGITDLYEIKQKYNEFAEGGDISDEEYVNKMEQVAEENYEKWGFENPDQALLHALNDNTYNYRGYYNDNLHSSANADTHWPDTYKTVWHPTFSNESKYSGMVSQYNPLGLLGGHWSNDTDDAKFVPQAWQLLQNQYADGGGIHIKEENRGKFTALKERTGHSATWFKRYGTPAQKKMATFALNARHWKHGDGGPLNLFYPGGEITYGRPYYSYGENGQRVDNTLNYNATIPEIVIVPDSRKSPAQRNENKRFRQRHLKGYAEQQSRDWTAKQAIAAQRAWDSSLQKKALDFGIAAAQGIGMASDVASALFSGIPVYSGLKGAQALDRATQSGDLVDYAESALWLSPMLTVAGKRMYDAAKPMVRDVFKAGTPAAEWAKEESAVFSNASGNQPKLIADIFAQMREQKPQSMLSEYDTKSTSHYANSQRNPVELVNERMKDPQYAEIIRNNSDPEYLPKEDAVYFEDINPLKPESTEDAVAKTIEWWDTHSTPYDGIPMKQAIVDELTVPHIFRNPFIVPPSNFIYMPEEKWLMTAPFIERKAATDAGRKMQYDILKAHEMGHYYAMPNDNSPIADMFEANHYFSKNNGAEILGRGTQLKNYFNKKTLNEKELKYAAEHYVEDTGINNEMTMMFDAIKEKEKTDPAIWRKMAVWMSKHAPMAGIPLLLNNQE